MHYSTGTVSLLATVFAFQANSMVEAVDADAGILSPDTNAANDVVASSSSLVLSTNQQCKAGYIDCHYGAVRDDISGTSCFTACGGNCCVGNYACDGFSGRVCKDGSCSSHNACAAATIPLVVNSCKGERACMHAGGEGGVVLSIVNSCNGLDSCQSLAWFNGEVGDVQDSCNGKESCHLAAGFGGLIGSVKKSCNAEYQACKQMGFSAGKVGDLDDSCNAEGACLLAAFSGGSIGSLKNSCNAVHACERAGDWFEGVISTNLKNCCNSIGECLLATQSSLPAACHPRTNKVNVYVPAILLLMLFVGHFPPHCTA